MISPYPFNVRIEPSAFRVMFETFVPGLPNCGVFVTPNISARNCNCTRSVIASLLALHLFRDDHELPPTLVATAALAVAIFRSKANRFWRFWAVFTGVLPVLLACGARNNAAGVLHLTRNLYGVLRVVDDPAAGVRPLFHGSVTHGQQYLAPARRAGLISLGAGTLAAYARPGDTYRFYEINPQVVDVARTNFEYLAASPGRIEIVPGDARLSLENEPPQQYDVLVVDAFSGDSVPVHLLTRRAAALYLRHLKPGGVLALHVSNNFLYRPPHPPRAKPALAW